MKPDIYFAQTGHSSCCDTPEMTIDIPSAGKYTPRHWPFHLIERQRGTAMQTWKQAARSSAIAASLFGFLFAAAGLHTYAQTQSSGSHDSKDVPVPIYKVDPFWPKPLPHKWILQGIPVMVADKDDHIWVVSRPRDANPDETGAATN